MVRKNKIDREELEKLSEVRQKVLDLIDSPDVSRETIDVILNEIHDKLILIILNNL